MVRCTCGKEFHELIHLQRHQRQFRYNNPEEHRKVRDISYGDAVRKGAQTRKARLQSSHPKQ